MAVKGQCGSSLWWGNYSHTWLLVLILYYNFKDVTFGGNQVFLKKRVYEISLCYFFELHVNLQLSHDKKFNENNYKRIGRKYSILFSWIYDRESLWNKTFDIEAVKEDINKNKHTKKQVNGWIQAAQSAYRIKNHGRDPGILILPLHSFFSFSFVHSDLSRGSWPRAQQWQMGRKL